MREIQRLGHATAEQQLVGLALKVVDRLDLSSGIELPIQTVQLGQYLPSVDKLAYAQRDTYEVDCNWKVLVDNFLECYHCATAHKDFVSLVDMDTYRTIIHRAYSSQCAGAPLTTDSNAYSF